MPASTTEVYLVNNLGASPSGIGQTVGRATTSPVPGGTGIVGQHTMAIDVNEAGPFVLLHELGHALWSLEHPGGPKRISPSGQIYNGQFGIDDLNNFMHGIADKIINHNIRRYQFHYIH